MYAAAEEVGDDSNDALSAVSMKSWRQTRAETEAIGIGRR